MEPVGESAYPHLTQTDPVSCGSGLWAISEHFDLFCLTKYEAKSLISKAAVQGSGERKDPTQQPHLYPIQTLDRMPFGVPTFVDILGHCPHFQLSPTPS